MALRLSLKPGERVIIGGSVVRNGDGRTSLVVENTVPVLRESDILSPRKVRTPCQRIYLALQLMYIQPQQLGRHLATYDILVSEVVAAAPSCQKFIRRINILLGREEYYRALKVAGELIQHERKLMSHVQ
ncbi:MAG: flagellar biosynthesis repressor FlbT [Gemmatimonadota bacterium]